ncbi:MAG: hypothetical protein IPM76_15525 [Chloroflexi bacterium]|nr:hypothetical protein [Chloroflexota bacterium]
MACLQRGAVLCFSPDLGDARFDFLLEAGDELTIGLHQRLFFFDSSNDWFLGNKVR